MGLAVVFCGLDGRPRATISGRTSISANWHQRAAALADSRPIKPSPMIPKCTVRMILLS